MTFLPYKELPTFECECQCVCGYKPYTGKGRLLLLIKKAKISFNFI